MIAIKVDGGEQLARTLETLPDRVSRKMQTTALLTAGERMRRDVQSKAPNRPGPPDLNQHILIAPVKRTRGEVASGTDAVVGLGVPKDFFYDWFSEFGTKHETARPFWRPAFDGNVQFVIKAVAAELWFALAKRGATTSRGGGGGVGL